MRILLIIPPLKISLDTDISPAQKIPHIGVSYLLGCLEAKKENVSLIDGEVERLSSKEMREKIKEFNPDIVGITASTQQIFPASGVAKLVKEFNPKIPVVIGGYHASAIPKETLEEFPDFDFAVFGEGEETFIELISQLERNSEKSKIRGIALRTNKEIVVNELRPAIKDLDSLSFPSFKYFKLKKYRPYYVSKNNCQIPLSTSRGCPYKCIFCFHSTGDVVRLRKIPKVVEEIERDIQEYGANQIFFTDETFTISRNRILELCENICKIGINKKIGWLCETRVDFVDKELLLAMKKANCILIAYGIESGNQTILNKIEKGITLQQAKEAVKLTKDVGIKIDTNFIIGHPYETSSTVMDTINFALQLDSEFTSFGILVPYPGTKIYGMVLKNEGGMKLLSRDWRKYGKQIGGALELNTLNRVELESWQRKAYMKFYLRPKKILNLLTITNLWAFPLYFAHQIQIRIKYILKKLKYFLVFQVRK